MKHESKKAKETSEEAARRARRERAKRRREKRASSVEAESSHAEEGRSLHEESPKVRRVTRVDGPPRGSDPAPDERAGRLPVREKERAGRMKTVISQDNILMMMVDADPSEVKIQFCNEHYDALLAKLKLHGIDHLITSDVKSLRARLNAKGVDPLWSSQEALIRLAINTIGSEGVVQHRCPVCALNKFDFVAQIALVMKQTCVRKPS